MFRRSLRQACAVSSPSACPCATYLSMAEQYKTQIAGGAALFLVTGLLYKRGKHNARVSLDREMLNNIKELQDELKVANASLSKLTKDLKVSQTAILGQETTIRKLQAAAEAQTTELKDVNERVQTSVKSLKAAEHTTQHELKEQRKNFAKLFAGKAELDTKVTRMEGQLTRCDDVPRLKELLESKKETKPEVAVAAAQTE